MKLYRDAILTTFWLIKRQLKIIWQGRKIVSKGSWVCKQLHHNRNNQKLVKSKNYIAIAWEKFKLGHIKAMKMQVFIKIWIKIIYMLMMQDKDPSE